MHKVLVAGLFPPTPLGIRLGLNLLGLAIGALNLAFLAELWPHTPAAKTAFLALEWLLLLAVLPQGLWWAWRWLCAYAYAGPAARASHGRVSERRVRSASRLVCSAGGRCWSHLIQPGKARL